MRTAILLIAMTVVVACGGSGGGGTPSGPFDVDLTPAGVNPNSFTALSEASLRFTNHDTVSHQIASSNCGELSTAAIAAGANATAKLGPGPKSCNFSDGLNPAAVAFQGSVTVLAPGNGY